MEMDDHVFREHFIRQHVIPLLVHTNEIHSGRIIITSPYYDGYNFSHSETSVSTQECEDAEVVAWVKNTHTHGERLSLVDLVCAMTVGCIVFRNCCCLLICIISSTRS